MVAVYQAVFLSNFLLIFSLLAMHQTSNFKLDRVYLSTRDAFTDNITFLTIINKHAQTTNTSPYIMGVTDRTKHVNKR